MDTQTMIHDYPLKELPEIFNHDEIDKIMYAVAHPKKMRCGLAGKWIIARNYAIAKLSYHLALRPQEVLVLKRKDIDLKAGIIRIPPEGNKLRKGRTLPLPKEVIEPIIRFLTISKLQFWCHSDYLFPSLQNRRLSDDRWQETFKEAQIQAGVYSGKTPYDLRHTKATEIYLKTKDPVMVANVLGHTTLESTKTYIHLATIREGYLEDMRKVLQTNFA